MRRRVAGQRRGISSTVGFEGRRGRSDREDVVPRQSGQFRHPRGAGRPEGHRPGVSREGKWCAFVLVDNGQIASRRRYVQHSAERSPPPPPPLLLSLRFHLCTSQVEFNGKHRIMLFAHLPFIYAVHNIRTG